MANVNNAFSYFYTVTYTHTHIRWQLELLNWSCTCNVWMQKWEAKHRGKRTDNGASNIYITYATSRRWVSNQGHVICAVYIQASYAVCTVHTTQAIDVHWFCMQNINLRAYWIGSFDEVHSLYVYVLLYLHMSVLSACVQTLTIASPHITVNINWQ